MFKGILNTKRVFENFRTYSLSVQVTKHFPLWWQSMQTRKRQNLVVEKADSDNL